MPKIHASVAVMSGTAPWDHSQITAPSIVERNKTRTSLNSSMEKFKELQTEGNKYFRRQEYGNAIICYTQALRLCPTKELYSNRAFAFTAVGKYAEALQDANEALALDPMFAKVLLLIKCIF